MLWTSKPPGIASYLAAGRLSDVLALIQVLAYDRDAARSEDGLTKELQRKPMSIGTWIGLAEAHPEFFRVRNEEQRKQRAALIARYVSEYVPISDDEEKRPPLDPDVVNKLMEIAIELHDRQVSRGERWKSTWLPMIVAVVAATATVTAAALKLIADTFKGDVLN